MFKPDDRFIVPKDENAKIWRYMDLAKFLWMLDKRCLYFSSVDKLKLEDPYEGSFQPSSFLKNLPASDAKAFADKVNTCGLSRTVNCWHLNEHESVAMWKVYSDSNKGIAIQSTFDRLRKAFDEFADDVHIGTIRYMDYEKQTFEGEWPIDIFEPVLTKRKSFEHEKELRAVIWVTSESTERTNDGSVLVPVDLNKLIESLYVSPSSPTYIKDVLQSLAKKHGVDVQIQQSELGKTPLY